MSGSPDWTYQLWLLSDAELQSLIFNHGVPKEKPSNSQDRPPKDSALSQNLQAWKAHQQVCPPQAYVCEVPIPHGT